MLKFRIKHIEGLGYYAQVKDCFLVPWGTIGVHIYGFGVYPSSHIDYPMDTIEEAMERCNQYRKLSKMFNGKVTYFHV